jgi:DNA (cytosine-5)-methyltransferase 1
MDTDKTITLGSLFDGIGGFPYAASFFGIKPLWASEVMPQAISVTRRHFPHMEHVGDITSLDGAALAPVDIITFGSPCQDLSVAGRRAGLLGARSGLFTEAIRIIDEMREKTNGRYPSYAVWENVPGALSSTGGRDFQAVLEAFAKTEIPVPLSGRWAGAGMVRGDGVDIAWRVFNACLWGVPQRRRRIFLVADFGGRRAGEILFVEAGLRGHPAPGGQARKGAARDACRGASGTVRDPLMAFAANQRDEVRDLGIRSGALAANPGMKQQTFIAERCLTPWDVQSRRIHPEDSQWPAMYSAGGGAHGYAAVRSDCLNPWDTQQAHVSTQGGAAPTLSGADGGGGRNPAGLVLVSPSTAPSLNPAITMRLREGCKGGGKGPLLQRERSGALATHGDQYLFAPAVFGDAAGSDTPVAAFGFDLQQITSKTNRSALKEVQPALCAAGNPHVVTTGAHPEAAAPDPIPIHDKATRHRGGGVTRGGDGSGNGLGVGEAGGPAPTLTSGDHHLVAAFSRQRFDLFREQDVASTQAASQCKGATDIVCKDTSGTGHKESAHAGYIVRRLTPTECERLQGFPDGWTRLGVASEVISDTRRYQMLGNSLAIPCVSFVLGNIAAQMDGTAGRGGEAARGIDTNTNIEIKEVL